MDDTNRNVNPDTNKDRPLTQKRDSLQSLTHKYELNLDANCLPNGHYKPSPLSLGQGSQPSGRAMLLEPIPPRLRRGRRLSDNAVLQSTQNVCREGSENSSTSDKLMTKMFSDSCMEALNFLKKAFEVKLVSATDWNFSAPAPLHANYHWSFLN